ncbi:MAG: site-specific tyrosine recombinase XerD [Methanomassiliicoccales archaeon PtaU1.Bin124]|nr:MAG: site-specific tyrosine recombinase XerD [Methanomassiliicoccales archaeon PtaU1.Bin124]
MGRYPFLTYAMKYLEKRKSLAPSSKEDYERKARFLNRTFVDLQRVGTVSTSNPKGMTKADIFAYIQWMRAEELEGSYMAKNLGFLKQICAYAGNNVFAQIAADGEELPKRTPKDLNSLSEDDLKLIFEKVEELKGWEGEVIRFLMWMYPFTGLRASELRLAQVEDINLQEWSIFVRHPKGEIRYGKKRKAPILPPARKAVIRFLKAREQRLKSLGISKCVALIPARHRDGTAGFYCSNAFRNMKKEIMEKVNMDLEDRRLDFHIKTMRDTFIQMCIDKNPDKTPAVSMVSGHSTTKTTETTYGRIRNNRALSDVQKLWGDDISGPAPENVKNPLIEKKFDISGYA